MDQLKPAPEETTETALHKGRLGVVGIVFFVVAAAAPLVGMTGAVPVAIVLGNGAAVPGAYLAVGITLLLFSVGYAAMSHRVTNTGAFFAYVGRGLGIGPGVGSAFVSLVAYLAVQLAIYGFFGAVASGEMDAQFGISLSWYWWSLIAWALVTALSLFSVDVGAWVLGVFMTLELLSLLIMSIAVFVESGGVDLGASFSPSNILVGGFTGSAGIALAFAFASYIGFEATAIYGEESKDPKRTVPVATYVAVILITVLFALSTLAIVTALGSQTVIDRVVEISSVGEPSCCGLHGRRGERGGLAGRLGRHAGLHHDGVAGAQQPVRWAARIPELRVSVLLLDGTRRRVPEGAGPGQQVRCADGRLPDHLGHLLPGHRVVLDHRQGPGAEPLLLVQWSCGGRHRPGRGAGLHRRHRLLPQGR
jgi:hypothetical protein